VAGDSPRTDLEGSDRSLACHAIAAVAYDEELVHRIRELVGSDMRKRFGWRAGTLLAGVRSRLRAPPHTVPCRVRKSIGHAARAYSWISPPRRSRRWSRSGGFEPTRPRLGPGVGGVSPRPRCGLWVL
jgi:hypothetical protein